METHIPRLPMASVTMGGNCSEIESGGAKHLHFTLRANFHYFDFKLLDYCSLAAFPSFVCVLLCFFPPSPSPCTLPLHFTSNFLAPITHSPTTNKRPPSPPILEASFSLLSPPPPTSNNAPTSFLHFSILLDPSISLELPQSQDEVLNHSRCRCPLCIRGRTASRSPTMCCKFSSSSSSIITSPSLN